jgi:MFS family permease
MPFAPAPARSPDLRHFWVVAAGNGLEFYSFLVYAFFAAQIGRSFFPGHTDSESLLLVLATFGVGFLTRPLGGVVIGVMGDIKGRKPALVLSMGLMAMATIGLALTPSQDLIGGAAPVAAILLRLLQGFALGGEVGPSSAWLLEAAPPNRRGLSVSLQFASQWAAGLAAASAGAGLAALLDADALTRWGWRAAMLSGVLVMLPALWLRLRLPETLVVDSSEHGLEAAPLQMGRALAGLMTLSGGTIATYVLSYLAVFGGFSFNLTQREVLWTALACSACGLLFNPIGGWLSDRMGRRPVILVALVLLLAVVMPCFQAMTTAKSPLALLGGAALMTAILALATPAMLTSLLENLPPGGRSGGAGIIYALAISLFGGTTQFAVSALMDATESAMAPAWYMMGAVLLALAGGFATRETLFGKINSG